jgi:hypothetical protein
MLRVLTLTLHTADSLHPFSRTSNEGCCVTCAVRVWFSRSIPIDSGDRPSSEVTVRGAVVPYFCTVSSAASACGRAGCAVSA